MHERERLLGLSDDEFLAEVWKIVCETVTTTGTDPYAKNHVEPRSVQNRLIGTLDDSDRRLEERVIDAWGTLCARGLVYDIHSVHHFRTTPAARGLRPGDLAEGWLWSGDVTKRFPEIAAWDPTVATYFQLAVQTLQAGVLEAAAFLLGGAAERLLDVLRTHLGSKVRDEDWRKRQASAEKIDFLAQFFRSEGKARARADLISAAEILEAIGHANRLGRNDVGHPRADPPRLSRFTVGARVGEFSAYVQKLVDAAKSV